MTKTATDRNEPVTEHTSAAAAADPKPLELLAPAGDAAALHAALEAGADAVYLGLQSLNARRQAANFTQQSLAEAVAEAQRRGARVYLTLNTDLSQRDLGQAARSLELASQLGIDAVLVRDPALWALKPHYPALAFHLSTQNCVTNSADATAAAKLGATRVVLAREMSLGEIAAASSAAPVETEVFVQGALCFSVSGRCQLSSWIGGRSGNRGSCTSPCRVPWSIEGGPREAALETPLSMRDLSAVERIDALVAAGVTALKIEGRMKSAAWVGRAVSLYRRARDSQESGDAESFRAEAAALGAYTGRDMTCGYLDDERDALTGLAAGRGAPRAAHAAPGDAAAEEIADSAVGATSMAASPGEEPSAEGSGEASDEVPSDAAAANEAPTAAAGRRQRERTYELHITVEARGVVFRFACGAHRSEWTLPRTVVRRPEKAVALANLLALLEHERFDGFQLGAASAEPPDFLLVPRAMNDVLRRIAAAVRQANKGPSDAVHLALPEAVRAEIEPGDPHPLNARSLGEPADCVRIDAADFAAFLHQVESAAMIVVGATAERFKHLFQAAAGLPLTVALPAVFFEDEVPKLRRLLEQCRQTRTTVEVNSWGGWLLARAARVRMEGGPGLAVLNALAARKLTELGLRSVTLSLEADRRQLEELTACCPAICELTVFGRPPLMTSRVALPAQQFEGRTLVDRRGMRMIARRLHGLWEFRPEQPFDLRNLTNERIRVRRFIVDLVGSPDPVGEWYDVPAANRETFRFNYDRTLG